MKVLQLALFGLAALLLTGFVPLESKLSSGDCIEELRAVVAKMAKLTVPEGDKAYYMHLTIIKQMAQGSKDPNTNPDTNQEVELVISATQLHYTTKTVSVYKDQNDVFTIIHPLKQVIRSKGTAMNYSEQGVAGVSNAQLKMIEHCSVQRCVKVNKGGSTLQELTLLADASFQKEAKVSTMRFLYDAQSNDLKEIETIYLKGHAMEREQLTIHNSNFNYQGILPKSIKTKLLNSKGELLPAYKGYSLIDQRAN